jgi:hypothetical protein
MLCLPSRLHLFVPTERDMEIVKTVARMRAVTSKQITRLLFPAQTPTRSEKITSQAKLRLTKLSRAGYLAQVIRLNAPAIYWLGAKGLRELRDLGLVSPDLRLYPSEREVTSAWLAHHLQTVDVWIAVALSCARHGIELVEFRDQREMQRTHRQDKVSIAVGERTELAAVVPDSFFHLRTCQGRDSRFLLEVDLGTETLVATTPGARDVARKIRGYLSFLPKHRFDHTSLYERRYGANPGRILWVVAGQRRLQHIKSLIFALGGRRRFWLTTIERMEAHDILTAPIWEVVPQEAGQETALQPLI